MRPARWTTALAVTLGLAVTGCAAPDDAAGDLPGDVSSPASGALSEAPDADGPTTSADSQAVADLGSYAVPPPGPRKDPLRSADVLITSGEPISDLAVSRVEGLDGVEAATRISVGQVSMENQVYNVAAVDPSTYRLFTPSLSAESQAQWDRVAGGEVAVRTALAKKLPLDDTGSLELGMGKDTMDVHVGAIGPQVEKVDMVVNEKRGEAMGMTMHNALLVSTGSTSPASLRDDLQRVASTDRVSVSNLDVVAKYGLDPDAFESAVLVGSFADAVGTFNYTAAGGGRINPDPAWVSSHISTQQVPILGSVTCNNALFPQLRAALGEIVAQGLADEIDPSQYAGCYYPRFIAGSTSLSNHSFGLALDLNTATNGRGIPGDMDRGVVAIFKRWGFAWGGDWNYTDPMHFELDRIVNPG